MSGKIIANSSSRAHHLRARRALGLPRAEHQRDLAVLRDLLHDESSGGLDLHPVRTPAELVVGCRISPADEIYPERFIRSRAHLVRLNRKPLFFRSTRHALQRSVEVVHDDRRLHQRVRCDDEHRLFHPFAGQFLEAIPDELQRCRRILTPAVPDYPRPRVGEVEG
jgi:hypothetical protein